MEKVTHFFPAPAADDPTAGSPERGKKRLELQDRLQSLIRAISRRPDLVVTTEVSPQTQFQMMREGKDARREWFREARIDQKTNKRVGELVHIPEQIFEINENIAKGKGAHEAGHVAITRHGEFVPDRIIQELGFHSLLAAMEERPTDHVVRTRYPGAGGWIDEARRNNTEEAVIATRGEDTLGRIPRFAQLCDLIVHEPHYGGIFPGYYSKEILDVYEKIRKDVEEVENTLPHENASELDVINQAKKRYKIVHSKIWPAVESLVEHDQKEEGLSQMLRQLLDQLLQKMSEQPGDQGEGGNRPQEQSGGGQQEKPDILDSLSAETKDKLQKILDAALQRANGEPSGEQPADQADEVAPSSSGTQTPKKFERKDIPPEALNELRKDLEQIWENLPPEKKDLLQKKALEALEDFEDSIVRELSGKLTGTPAETHEEHARREEAEEKDAQKKAVEGRIKKELAEIEHKQAALGRSKDIYETIYHEMSKLDLELYNRLEEIFTPNVKRGASLRLTGARLNMPAVFRWQARREAGAQTMDNKIFEVLVHPEKRDYAITLLVDLSGSMQGEKIQKTFKAVVLLGEVLNRLGVKNEILGFQDEVIDFKHFGEILDDTLRKKISGMIAEVGGDNPGGHNRPSYNDDGPCLTEASRGLEQEHAKEKFLLVLSDGNPEGRHSNSRDLENAVSEILSTTGQKLVGIGLGSETDHVKKFYPTSLPSIDINALPQVLGDLLEDLIKNPQKYQHRQN